jgi:hypothetical protein
MRRAQHAVVRDRGYQATSSFLAFIAYALIIAGIVSGLVASDRITAAQEEDKTKQARVDKAMDTLLEVAKTNSTKDDPPPLDTARSAADRRKVEADIVNVCAQAAKTAVEAKLEPRNCP